uniref:SWIM-type domain-containing protein n=1 Tax=Nicotiana tabacum TaxID=4097 RepID=A0A1S3YU52_TOBAC|nr:PREDICTED: uncharacterized protein LOC107779558 [Nicotiana tabacum]
MELLRSSLELGDGEGVTFMSDIQKGLLDAVSTVVPKSHHRWCVRHLKDNWSKNWRGLEKKKLLWWCAWSTYEEEFKDHLNTMGDINENAAKDLIWYPPQNWCRSYFDTTCKNYMVMTMLKDREEERRIWRGEFSPYAMELLNDFTQNAQGCEVVFNGDNGYEVVEGAHRHTVNLLLKKCTCRTWDLSGIPCPHAIKALDNNKEDPLSEVHWWYSKKAYMLVYMHKLQPVRGDKF